MLQVGSPGDLPGLRDEGLPWSSLLWFCCESQQHCCSQRVPGVEEPGIVFSTVNMVLLNSCILFTAQFLPFEGRSVARGAFGGLSKHGVPPRSCNSQGNTQGVVSLQSRSPLAEQTTPHEHRAGLAFVVQRGGNRAGNLLSGAGNGAQQPVWGGDAAVQHGILAHSRSQSVS